MEHDADGSSLISLILLATLCWQVWWSLRQIRQHDKDREHDDHGAAALPLLPHQTTPFPAPAVHDGRVKTDQTARHTDMSDAIGRIRIRDPGFELAAFLEGAQIAYETVVTAFLTGHPSMLEPLVTADIRDAFLHAMAVRKHDAANTEASLIHLASPEVISVGIVDGHAEISVRFIGEWLSAPLAADDISGESACIETSDEWTFARKLQADDPNWLVTATN